MQKDPRRYRKLQYIATLVFIGALVLYTVFSSGSSPTKLSLTEDSLTLTGDNQATVVIWLSEVTSITLAEDIDPGQLVAGTEEKEYLYGVFKNGEWGQYHLCATEGVTRYIVLETENSLYVVNEESDTVTDSYYNTLLNIWAEAR